MASIMKRQRIAAMAELREALEKVALEQNGFIIAKFEPFSVNMRYCFNGAYHTVKCAVTAIRFDLQNWRADIIENIPAEHINFWWDSDGISVESLRKLAARIKEMKA